MKSAVFFLALAFASFFGLSQKALATCTDGSHQAGTGAIDPYFPVSDHSYDQDLPLALKVSPTAGVRANNAAASAPAARITVVDAGLPGIRATKASVPAVRLTVVHETTTDSAKSDESPLDKTQPEASEVAEAAAAKDAGETLDPALKGLVGTWMAVARHGDGELATVELQLDNRGWAKLTVPGTDGKPSTMKRRLELQDDELKLTGPDAELTLGKLIEVSGKQMVLARADGQITFVRP